MEEMGDGVRPDFEHHVPGARNNQPPYGPPLIWPSGLSQTISTSRIGPSAHRGRRQAAFRKPVRRAGYDPHQRSGRAAELDRRVDRIPRLLHRLASRETHGNRLPKFRGPPGSVNQEAAGRGQPRTGCPVAFPPGSRRSCRPGISGRGPRRVTGSHRISPRSARRGWRAAHRKCQSAI